MMPLSTEQAVLKIMETSEGQTTAFLCYYEGKQKMPTGDTLKARNGKLHVHWCKSEEVTK